MSELDAILSNFETALQDDNSNPIQVEILNLSSNDPKKQERSLREIINSSLEEHNREFITQRDGVGPIVHILNSPSAPVLRALAAHALANLALTQSARFKISQAQGVTALISALSSPSASGNLKERCFAALANLTVSEEEIRYEVIRAGGIGPILRAIQSSGHSDLETVRTGLMLVANLGVSPQGCQELVNGGATDICCGFAGSSDPGVRRHALWACAALSSNPNSHHAMEGRVLNFVWPLQSGGAELVDIIKSLTILVNLSGSPNVQSSISGLATTILNYISGSEVNCKVLSLQITQNMGLSDAGRSSIARVGGARTVLDGVRSLEHNGDLVVHGLRAITNLTQDDRMRAEMVQGGAVDLVRRLTNSADPEVRESASQALSNLTI